MNKLKLTQKGQTTLLCLLIANICSSQTTAIEGHESSPIQNFRKEKKINKTTMSIEIISSILPKAKITRKEGKYKLQSYLQSSYDLGLNFIYEANKSTSISTGIHFVVGKWNFFKNFPPQDLLPYITDGKKMLESKGLWGAFRFPFLFEKKIDSKKNSSLILKTGINIRYSGLMLDLGIGGGGYYDQNGQMISIFSGDFSGDNNYKPWITFLVGGGKVFSLKNKNILSICLQADISGTYFYIGTYEITIPNQPVSTGTYKINGTSLGLSVQYIFAGENKRIIRSYEKKGF